MVNDICKINNENKYRDRLPKLVAAFLASFSIIEPYVLFSIGSGTGRFTIRFADFFLLIVLFCVFQETGECCPLLAQTLSYFGI